MALFFDCTAAAAPLQPWQPCCSAEQQLFGSFSRDAL